MSIAIALKNSNTIIVNPYIYMYMLSYVTGYCQVKHGLAQNWNPVTLWLFPKKLLAQHWPDLSQLPQPIRTCSALTSHRHFPSASLLLRFHKTKPQELKQLLWRIWTSGDPDNSLQRCPRQPQECLWVQCTQHHHVPDWLHSTVTQSHTCCW